MLLKYLLFLLGASIATARHVNFFRKDYKYVEEFDAYYKLHWDLNGASWSSSFLACDDEGAELFYPQSPTEWVVVKRLVEAASDAPNVTDVFVGIHDKFGLGEFITINGHPTPSPILNLEMDMENVDRCVTMNIETGELSVDICLTPPDAAKPFVCKKEEDVSCPTIDKGYKYIKETKKCYKINNRAKSWAEAMQTCYKEGGILVVLTSDVEADVLYRNIREMSDSNNNDYYFAGFKKIFPNDMYYTVTGNKVQDSGFDKFYERNSNECGVLWPYNNQMYYNTLDCHTRLPFVCEMSVQT